MPRLWRLLPLIGWRGEGEASEVRRCGVEIAEEVRIREEIDDVLAPSFGLVVVVGFSSPSCHWRCIITDFVAHCTSVSHQKLQCFCFVITHSHLCALRCEPL